MFNKRITLILMFIALVCISFQPVSASDNLKQLNVKVVSDLNQTVGKDLISLVDTNRLEIGNTRIFDIIWSPDGNRMLIYAFVNAYPKEKFQLGGIDALYIANADGSGVERVAWAESTSSSERKRIKLPVWSQSGDYFAYVERVAGSWHKLKAADLFVMSNDLNLIKKVELDPDKARYFDSEFKWSFKWAPKENKIALATLASEDIIIYDLDEKTNFTFNIPGDNVIITDMEWAPDGNKIVFIIKGDRLLTLELEKRKINPIYSAECLGMYDGKGSTYGKKLNGIWSADGKKLIFYDLKRLSENFDVYIKDEASKNPIKIITFNSGSSRVIQWYPDNERILLRNYSNALYALYSFSINGEMKKLIEKDNRYGLEGMVGPNDYILATSLNPQPKTPPYIRTYDLFLLKESKTLTIENVSDYRWKGTDLLYLKDQKISILNTSTHDTWDIPLPSKNIDKFSLDPSGHFIVVDTIILGIQEQGSHTQQKIAGNYTNNSTADSSTENNSTFEEERIKKDMDEHSRGNSTKETFELPGFSAIIALIGVLIAFVGIHIKK